MQFIVTNKLILSTRVIFDEGFMHYYNFKINNLPDIGAMRITEEKLIEFNAFLNSFQKPNEQAFTAFVKIIEKFNQNSLVAPKIEEVRLKP